ncbi:MAG: hypothetical protein GY851_06350, partial [bacterium]|nr:hypothetical protein [bacterium]
RMQHFLNLSAFPDTEGQFGRLDEDGRPVPGESIDSCILLRGGMMQFHNGNLQFGDMNGDGLQDIVDLKSGSLAYWPNRGYGQWGDSDEDCAAGEYVDRIDIEMDGSPHFSNPDNEGVSLADVNGDGLADLIQIRFDAVDIWLNRGDNSFTERHIIEDTPATNSGFYAKVRLADLNGSGTVDLVWADAGGYKYIDLAGYYRELEGNGGLPAGLLERVDNGLGGTTTIDYATTTELMVDAQEQGNAWSTVAPMPMTVVRKVTTTDNLDVVGGARGEYTQEYVYRDPFYDGHEAEFKGFGYAEAWDRERDANGDGEMDAALCSADSIKRGEAPIVARNWFHRGVRPECMEPPVNEDWPSDWGPTSKACDEQQHRDNPLLGLTGASIMSDVYSPCTGKVVSATASEIEVRELFESNDPNDDRSVTFIIPNQGRVYKYDPNAAQGGGASETYAAVNINGTDLPISSIDNTYLTVAPIGQFHRVVANTVTNDHGYPTESHYGGFHRYSGDDLYAHANCDQYSAHYTTTFDPATWLHTATASHMVGPSPEDPAAGSCDSTCTDSKPCNILNKYYNDWGELIETRTTYRDWDESDEKTFVAVRKTYNDYGQVLVTRAGCPVGGDDSDCLRHTENVYTDNMGDEHYSAFIRQEIAHVADGKITEYVFNAEWDAGFTQITKMVSPDGTYGIVEYDALGRFLRAKAWNPDFQSDPSCSGSGPVTTKEVFYHYGNESHPMSMLETWINTSQSICGEDRWEYMYTWLDAMGRGYASVVRGDTHVTEDGDTPAYPWLVSGTAELNAKGIAVSSCEGLPISTPPVDAAELIATQNASQAALAGENPCGGWNCTRREFDAYGRVAIGYAPFLDAEGVCSEVRSMAEYGVDRGNSWDEFDLDSTRDDYQTYSSQRVDGLGRTVEMITRHKEGVSGGITERKYTVKFGDSSVVTSKEEDGVRVSRRVLHDSLGRVRRNLDVNFGEWRYEYDDIGQLIRTISPTGDVSEYFYDRAGRLTSEYAGGELEAAYYYDVFDSDVESALGLDTNPEWNGYPAWATTLGSLVAVKDRAGIAVTAANFGTKSNTWRMVYPDERLYFFQTEVNGAGELLAATDPDGNQSTATYYTDGTFKSSFWEGNRIVVKTRSNFQGQTELVQYGDHGETMSWSGYNPVTHQAMATVVQQQDRFGNDTNTRVTLMSFGYEYDKTGKLTGIADWRGRGAGSSSNLGLHASHPTAFAQHRIGSHQAAFPATFDSSLAGPPDSQWNAGDVAGANTASGWPVGASPSDAKMGYDTLYQLTSEDRQYVTTSGDDSLLDKDLTVTHHRVRSLDWKFDAQGSMIEWTETDPGGYTEPKNLGRALGDVIQNGFQLNQLGGNTSCMDHLYDNNGLPTGCYIPDALYFAGNTNQSGAGPGTCAWVEYDAGGRMIKQTVRTGCTTCAYDGLATDKGVSAAICPGHTGDGSPSDPDVEAHTKEYNYFWNALGQLAGAEKRVDGTHEITMSYRYDAAGGRVIREKQDPSDMTSIRQDLYISGGYERRGVQLTDPADSGNPAPIGRTYAGPTWGTFDNIVDSRKVVYSSGLRVEWEHDGSTFGAEKKFLSFSNHLGSTSAVIDYDTGDLVEWKTNYAYGADESHWKNEEVKYDNAEEPYGFTGKEEDEAVGLFYFGARYYSAYLGRWLSPDPPVVHGGGISNYYRYGRSSPYIYIDPDGNWDVGAIVAAVVGGIIGAIQEGISSNGNPLAIIWGSVKGSSIALAGYYGGPLAGAGASTMFSQLEMLYHGGAEAAYSADFHKASAINFSTSAASGYASVGVGYACTQAGVQAAGKAMAGYAASTVMTFATSAATGGLTQDNWDEILLSSSASYWGSYAGNAVGNEIAGLGGGNGGNNGNASTNRDSDNGSGTGEGTVSHGNPKPPRVLYACNGEKCLELYYESQ